MAIISAVAFIVAALIGIYPSIRKSIGHRPEVSSRRASGASHVVLLGIHVALVCSRPGAHQRHSELLAIFFAFNSLSEISFRFGQAWILAALVIFLNNVQNPLNGTTESSVLANFELAR